MPPGRLHPPARHAQTGHGPTDFATDSMESAIARKNPAEVAAALEREGIAAEIMHIGGDVPGCRACGACRELGRCVIGDGIFDHEYFYKKLNRAKPGICVLREEAHPETAKRDIEALKRYSLL